MIESDDEVMLRSTDEILRRLIALWAVTGAAYNKGNRHYRDYIVTRDYDSWLSKEERLFLHEEAASKMRCIQFSWRHECLFFLGWAAGLIPDIEIPSIESKCGPMMDLFPDDMEEPIKLRNFVARQSGDSRLVGFALSTTLGRTAVWCVRFFERQPRGRTGMALGSELADAA